MKNRGPSDPHVAIAYVRVSTDTERQGLGAEGQRSAIDRWAREHQVAIAAWLVEEVSGGASLDRRPVLLEAIAALAEHGAGLLLVQRLDRFSREPLTAALAENEIRRNGAMLQCADGAGSGDDPTAELVRGILLSVARFEKAMIRARIKTALAVKKARGEMTGAPPFGFRVGSDGKSLVACPSEQETTALLRAWRAEGLSIRSIVRRANESGIRGRRGRPLSVASVHAIVAHEAVSCPP